MKKLKLKLKLNWKRNVLLLMLIPLGLCAQEAVEVESTQSSTRNPVVSYGSLGQLERGEGSVTSSSDGSISDMVEIPLGDPPARQEPTGESFWAKLDYIKSDNPDRQAVAAGLSVVQNLSGMLGTAFVPATTTAAYLGDYELAHTFRNVGQSASLLSYLLGLPEVLKSNKLNFCKEGHLQDKFFSGVNLAGHLVAMAGFGVLSQAYSHESQAIGGCLLTTGQALKALSLYYNVHQKGLDGSLGKDIMNNHRSKLESAIINVGVKATLPPVGNCLLATAATLGGDHAMALTGASLVGASGSIGNVPELTRGIRKLYNWFWPSSEQVVPAKSK